MRAVLVAISTQGEGGGGRGACCSSYWINACVSHGTISHVTRVPIARAHIAKELFFSFAREITRPLFSDSETATISTAILGSGRGAKTQQQQQHVSVKTVRTSVAT